MQLSAIIIDDKSNTTNHLQDTLSKYCPEILILGTAHSIQNGASLIKNNKPQLIFLDVLLSSTETGFDLLDLFPNRKFHVIFVTQHSQYGLQAIKYRAFDYILKPIDYKELIKSIHALKQIHFKPVPISAKSDVIMIPSLDGTHIVQPSDILYCKADGSYSIFKLVNNQRLVLSRSLKHAEALLSDERFKRVHRSFIINTNKVSKFYIQDGGFVKILKDKIPISKIFIQKASQLFST
jgi:two-component system LytT family response regulator